MDHKTSKGHLVLKIVHIHVSPQPSKEGMAFNRLEASSESTRASNTDQAPEVVEGRVQVPEQNGKRSQKHFCVTFGTYSLSLSLFGILG